MKPIEFVTNVGHHNNPVGDEMDARVNKELRIFSDSKTEWEVLSYYLTPQGMVLDIRPKKPRDNHRR